MESFGLKEFLSRIGSPIHDLNTICVGLDGVERGVCKKTDDLTITWSSKDIPASARKARTFAIKATIVFIVEALLQYFNYLEKHPAVQKKIKNALAEDEAAKKVEYLSKEINVTKQYWGSGVLLLIHWRNRIVHSKSNAHLNPVQEKILIDNSKEIYDKHAAIDITRTLKDFYDGEITLKDISTLISMTIRFVRDTDEQIQCDSDSIDVLHYWIRYLGKEKEYLQCYHYNGDTKARKIRSFFNTYLPFVSEGNIDFVIDKCLEFQEETPT